MYFHRVLISVTALVALVTSGGCSFVHERKKPTDFPIVVSQEIKVPKPERWMLANGLSVVLMSNAELPVVAGTLFTRGGTLWDNSAAPGSVDLMGDLMSSAGAGKYTADELELELERRAAGITSAMSAENATISFSTLKVDLPFVFDAFSQVVLKPRFQGDRFDLLKKQSLELISRRDDDPSSIANTAFNQLIYPGSVYGRVLTSADVKRISRNDVLNAYQEYIRPDGAILALTGDIDRKTAESLVEKYFSQWQSKGAWNKPLPAVKPIEGKKIVFIEKPLAQATVVLGLQGVGRVPPDFAQIEIFNELFGSSGFSSALMQRVRTQLGLAYGVGGGIVAGPVKGKNFIYAQTKQQSAFDALAASLAVLDQFKEIPPKPEDVVYTKAAAENSFVFSFEDPGQVLMRQVGQELAGIPKDYDQKFIPAIQSVTAQQVVEVANKYWDLSQAVVVVVGSKEAYNSIEQGLKQSPQVLPGFKLIKGTFNEKLQAL